ncbi:MAG TPA: Spy/CpxP family protein refolding chaperone [Gemmatimonadales bacterium]|nr:Spy/CpxP family protein refolding chaperone [Gemmatimonadales bacterium]
MKTTAWLVVLAAAAAPLAAQQHPAPPPHGMGMGGMSHDDMMPGMDSMMAPMMRAMAYAPQHLLREKTTLHLTTDQITLLTNLADSAKAAHDAAAGQAKMHMGELEQVMQVAAPDTAAVRAHFDAAHRLMGDAMWAMLRASAQARALLTDAQRSQVDAMGRRPMHHGMAHHDSAGH